MQRLASHANADGSKCFPAIETLAEDTNWSVRQVKYYLADLAKLGFVINEGRQGENGPRVRRLVLPAEAQDRAQAKLENRRERKGKKKKSEVQDRNSERQDNTAQVQDRSSEVQI